jgi:DNA-binding winged helix-turn-helix (wHTH) protein
LTTFELQSDMTHGAGPWLVEWRAMEAREVLRFGVFELDPAAGELRRQGVIVPLQDLPLRLLSELARRPGELLARDTLRAALWGEDVFVDFDAGLNTAVRRVREALGDTAVNSRFVETVPRRGYRFLASVETAAGDAEPVPPSWAREPALWAALAVVAAAGAGWWLGRSGAPESSPGRPVAATAEARVEILRARHFSQRRTRDGLEKAIAAYQTAVASDPDSAAAYSGLAGSYLLLGVYDYWRPSETYPPARRLIDRALALDDRSAEAQMIAGMLAAVADWDWRQAEERLDRALALDPRLTDAHLYRGVLDSFRGRHDEGIAETLQALALEPTSPVVNTRLAWQYFVARRPQDAVEQTRRTLELAPDYYDTWDDLKWMQITWGHEAEAIAAWKQSERIAGGKPDTGLETALDDHGLRAVMLELVRRRLQVEARDEATYRSPYDLVIDLVAVGELDLALDWLERSRAERETDLLAIAVDPRLDPLRGRPRFEAIVDAVGLGSP